MSQSEEQRWGWKLWKRLQWTLSYKVQSQVQAQIKMVNLVNIFRHRKYRKYTKTGFILFNTFENLVNCSFNM